MITLSVKTCSCRIFIFTKQNNFCSKQNIHTYFFFDGKDMDSYGLFGCGIYGALTVITAYQIYDHVPEPYMDEIFHIPQAQKYCSGKFLEVCCQLIIYL